MKKNVTRSRMFFKEACQHIPGGVNSPVRAFKAVGGKPLFIKRGAGSKIYDVDGNAYIDYVMSWGPLILGHAHPQVITAVKKAAERGTSFGAPTESETELASLVKSAFPSIKLMRFVSSGTEAVMSAIRLARGYTKKNIIIKFEGCYHGHTDSLLVQAGSGVATLGIPDSAGVPSACVSNTIVLPYNDIPAVTEAVHAHRGEIACIIVEPVAGNMGVVPPQPGFLKSLREITKKENIVLIFDEVITGFRVAYGGAQQVYHVSPDLTCLGKIIGGGMPVGAFGGRKEIMEYLAPTGPVYQAGTLSGNPVTMAAGRATLKLLSRPGIYAGLEKMSARLVHELEIITTKLSVPVQTNRVGSMFSVFFTDRKVINYATAKRSNTDRYKKYFWEMIKNGIYVAPSPFESAFVSLAHSQKNIDTTIDASREALKATRDQ